MYHKHTLTQGTATVMEDILIGMEQRQGFLASPTQRAGGGVQQSKWWAMLAPGLGDGTQALLFDNAYHARMHSCWHHLATGLGDDTQALLFDNVHHARKNHSCFAGC